MRIFCRWISRLALAAFALATLAGASSAQIKINEIRIDQGGTDTDEYFELMGPAGASLTGLTYIVVGDSGDVATCGVIEAVIPLTGRSIQADGFFVAVDADPGPTLPGVTWDWIVPGPNGLNFENTDNVTHMLVSAFTGSLNQDLDTNDDGVFNVTPWTTIVDAVGLNKGTVPNCAGEDYLYTTTRVGPDGSFVPGHVYRCSDSGLWRVGLFNLGSTDTPGRANLSCLGPLPEIIDETRAPCVPLVGQAATATALLRHVSGANLHYKANGGAETVVAMTFAGLSGTDSVFQGLIPGRSTNGDLVEYRVKAFNTNPDTVSGFGQGYFAGTANVSAVRNNDAFGQTRYPFYGVRVRGTVTVADSVFTTIDTDYYVQDLTGGINVFKFGRHQIRPGLGDDVTITGVLDQFRGKLELTEGGPCDSMFVVINDVGAPPDPLTISPCTLGEAYEGMLVRMNPTRLVTTDTQFPAGSNKDYALLGCDPTLTGLRIDRDTDIDGQAIPSPAIDVIGVVAQFDTIPPYSGDYQITPRAYADITFLDARTSVGGGEAATAALFPVRPNPFSRVAQIRFRIPGVSSGPAVHARLTALDIQGREIATLADGLVRPGEHLVRVDGAALGRVESGIVFYRLEVAGRVWTRKAIYLR